MKWSTYCGIVLLLIASFTGSGLAVDTEDTRLLSQPALSRERIAFVYAGDLWTARVDGSGVQRITSDAGRESGPLFSPDGQWIAFNAEYDGNTDVYIVSAEGGSPFRLTYHPAADIVCDFTPDGKAVLFRSPREVFTRRYNQFFTVGMKGGFPQKLPVPNGYKASYSPDGRFIAYTPLGERFHQWKNYRGGTVSRIWILDLSDHSVEQIPQPPESCNDTDPLWMGEGIYFRSDRNGEFNIFIYNTKTRRVEQITHHKRFGVLDMDCHGSAILYEQEGSLHMLQTTTGESNRLKVNISADLPELRQRYIKGSRYIRSATPSPSGKRAVFGFRGEIITVPAKKGDPRNLTRSPGVHERYPAWSPDGKHIAYFSDQSGEYGLHVQSQDGRGTIRKIPLKGSGFYGSLNWSPDSKKLSFADNSRTLFWVEVATGRVTKILADTFYDPGAFGSINGVWSPDSRWIAYAMNTKAFFHRIFLYSLEEKKSYAVTDGLSDADSPVFDENGKYLYFFASTDAGPVKHWFAMSSADMEMTRSIYLVTMQKETLNPLARESDEEGDATEDNQKDENKKEEDKQKGSDIHIDFKGLDSRIVALDIPAGNYYDLQAGREGVVTYLEAPVKSRGTGSAKTKLQKYNIEKREQKTVCEGINGYTITADKKKILYRSGSNWYMTDLGEKIKSGDGKLSTNSIEVRIDPAVEWKQIFDEAWRINRDYFYAANMHGADWGAMKDKYEPFLKHLASRDDLNRVIMWMCSEIGVGHHRVGGGERYAEKERVPGGLLGADYELHKGRYRFKKVYGGLNWNPSLRSPLRQPGVYVNDGEYLLAVNGRELLASENIFSRFENSSGKIVEITVGPKPGPEGSRSFTVVPVPSESALRNRDWVELNIEKVNKATNGRVAYVYVPNTTTLGHTYFKRYFFPQVDKDAVIIDERFNGGGLIADYYVDILRRKELCYWHMRYGEDYKTPSASIRGPKVMLIDETAGSGGDMLPWMFRQLKLGTLVGKKTWGGLVGTLGFPPLMDGGYVTAPNLAIWTEEGWIVENVGVPPDVEVEQWPAQINRGHDPQLEKAIEIALEQLKADPVKRPKRPPYPIRGNR